MPTLSEIFDKRKILLYQNESLDLDHYYQEPYQDENDEIKEMGKPFETFEGSPVYTADNNDIEIALGLDNIDERTAITAGLMKTSSNDPVPIKYNGDFLIGPEGAHMNISGISGLATKTSYVMFLLKAIQYKYKDDVAIIVMNVKGDDLLHIHQPNEKITLAQRAEWDALGIPCEPFENVKYLYPYRRQKDKLYANTALSIEDLAEQYDAKQAANFVYAFF